MCVNFFYYYIYISTCKYFCLYVRAFATKWLQTICPIKLFMCIRKVSKYFLFFLFITFVILFTTNVRCQKVEINGVVTEGCKLFQIGAGLYAVGRPVQQKRTAKSAPITPCPSREGPYSTVFFGKPAHGPPHVAGWASGPIGGCRDESRTDNPDLDLRHMFNRTLN